MSFTATTYRVLIASPSDLTEEREAASMAINDWNAQHAVAEGIVLLPVKWETHARPESDVRPQAAINAQIVHTCDILVGMFWTTLGSDTGVAESGTVEEINQFVEQQKPTLLYFSDRARAPSRIDLKQLQKLKDFKDSTYKQALVGQFSQIDELRHTLLRDLTMQVRTMKRVSKRGSRTAKLRAQQTLGIRFLPLKADGPLETFKTGGRHAFECECITPPGNDIFIFLSKGGEWWPQPNPMRQVGQSNIWEAVVHFGAYGAHTISIVKASELGIQLIGYYRKIVGMNVERQESLKRLNLGEADVKRLRGGYPGIAMPRLPKGLDSEAFIAVEIAKPPEEKK
jgi:hypothetical protein